MKKSFVLFSALGSGLFFAVPSFAAENSAGQGTGQAVQSARQSVQQSSVPVQVNVNVNTSAHAQGNTQTAEIFNTQNQTQTQYAAAAPVPAPNAVQSGAKRLSGADSLYGDYAESPYQSNLQTEMLRHTVWGSLVPRKKIYGDPALGKYPPRYSASKPAQFKLAQSKPAVSGNGAAVQNGPQTMHIQGTINGTVNGTFTGTVTGTASETVSGAAANEQAANERAANSAAVPNTAKETGKTSFYEPMNAAPTAQEAVGPRQDVQEKVESIQDALLIPKV